MTVPLTNVIVVASPRITDARLLGLVDPLERIAAILWGHTFAGSTLYHRRVHQAGRHGNHPDEFIRALKGPPFNGHAGNKSLREQLGWDEDRYWMIRIGLMIPALLSGGEEKAVRSIGASVARTIDTINASSGVGLMGDSQPA